MRIPFIPRVETIAELQLEPELLQYIKASKGGSAFLLAGACFWLLTSLVSVTMPASQVPMIIYGGLLVPFLSLIIVRLQDAHLFGNIRYASLAGFSVLTELVALPIMLYLKDSDPHALPAILMIADGAHLVIYMWLFLDYYYFLAAHVKVLAGVLFLFGVVFAGSYPLQTLISGITSLVAAVLIWKDSSRTEALYLKR